MPGVPQGLFRRLQYVLALNDDDVYGCRYDHVGCSLHVKKCGIELHARPWHWGWRPVLGDHFLNK